MYQPNLQSVALAVPEIIAIAVLVWGCEPRGEAVVTFPQSLRVSRDIAAFCSSTPLSHPTCSLSQLSPCSPGIRWMVFGLRRAKVLVHIRLLCLAADAGYINIVT